MRSLLLTAALVAAGVLSAAAAGAQEARQETRPEARPETRQEAGPQDPGHVLVLSRCFQCHTDAMYRDLRQDRRAWEATAYRMIGRGALWTPEEVRLMADYLGSEYGPAARSAAAPR
jgi:mono/diheme cytochrome c family protein